MAEKTIEAIFFSLESYSHDLVLKLPIAVYYTNNYDELCHRIKPTLRRSNRNHTSFFIITSDETMAKQKLDWSQFEENQRIRAVFDIIDDKCDRRTSNGKIYYVPKGLLTVTVSLMAIHHLKNDAKDSSALGDQELSDIYVRNSETIKNWLINSIRATPPHILVIPLNTSRENLLDAIREIEKSCNDLGFSSTIIRTLSEYIPKTEIHDKLPYGKQYFEHERHPEVCQLLRDLCPVRFYLYGNEPKIKSVWSEFMISEETDPLINRQINDDNLFWLLEHEPISESSKWNLFGVHSRNWKLKNLQPIRSDSLTRNLIFQSGLRRTHTTYETRQTRITARLFNWYHINQDNKTLLTTIPKATDLFNPLEQVRILLDPEHEPSIVVELSVSKVVEKTLKSIQFSYLTDDRLKLLCEKFVKPLYIWIGENVSIDPRFDSVIFPDKWTHFFDLTSYEMFIQNPIMTIEGRLMILVLSTTFAREFFARIKNIRKFKTIYLFGQKNRVLLEYINQYENIQGIHQSIDSLFEQFQLNIRSETISPATEAGSFLPFSFLRDDSDVISAHKAVLTSLANIAPKPTKEEFDQAFQALNLDTKITSREKLLFTECYQPYDAIRWYTRNGFLYRLINQSLARQETESVKRYQVFIDDLLRALNKLYEVFRNNYDPTVDRERLVVYRGQAIRRDELTRLKANIGEYVRLESFLSTTESISVASMFADTGSSSESTSALPVIFSFTIDLTKPYDTSFASIESESCMADEEEYLFSMGALFRIVDIEEPSAYSSSWFVHLQMIDQIENHRFFSDLFDEKLHYRLVIHPDQLEKIESSNELKNYLQQSNISLFDARQVMNRRNLDFNDDLNWCFVLPNFVHVSNLFEHCTEIRYDPTNTHINDLIYLIVSDMKKKIRLVNAVKLHEDFMSLQQIPPGDDFYVHLLHTPNYQFINTRFKDQFPSSPVVLFYQPDSCSMLFEMITQTNFSGHINLLIQSDDLQVDDLVERFEKFRCVQYIHLCTKNRSLVKNRRVIQSLSANEDEFYYQLIVEHAARARRCAREQIEVQKNPKQALEYLEDLQKYEQILTNYRFDESTSI